MSMTQAPPSNQSQNHTRVIDSLLGKAEKKALLWLAPRMPGWVMPDTLTSVGLFASLLIFLGYALSFYDKNFLWLASFGFVLNWFGDSMDGTLARYRKIERPRYGFFVDHIINSVNEVFIFVGIGLSPYVRIELALFALIVYLLLSVFVYLGTYVNGVFRISYAGLSPTETRLLAVLANTFVFFANNPSFQVFAFSVTFYDIVAIVLIVTGSVIFTYNSIRMANDLSREDRIARRAKVAKERKVRRLEHMARRQTIREERARRKRTAGEVRLTQPNTK